MVTMQSYYEVYVECVMLIALAHWKLTGIAGCAFYDAMLAHGKGE